LESFDVAKGLVNGAQGVVEGFTALGFPVVRVRGGEGGVS
jgi:hypothetical protein